MKRIFTLSLAAIMLLAVLAGCTNNSTGGDSGSKELTTEERTTLYKNAIEGARDEQTNTDFPLIAAGDADVPDMLFDLLGITKDDLGSYAMYVSMMNVQAYAVVVAYPAEGKSDAVMKGMQGFIDLQKQNFDKYLMDQYEIASNAKLEKLDDGTILLVMCENQDEIFTSIKTAIAEGTK